MISIKKNPEISVIVPVYNGDKFILEAIDSVVNQTLSPNKIIVVDDGSTDDTHNLVSKYKETSRVEIEIIKKENGGLSSARNAGMKACNTEFIAFLDADDIWYPNKLEEQINIYQNTSLKNLGLVYCDYDVINTSGEKDRKSYKVPIDKNIKGNVFNELLKSNKILSSGSGVLIKRNVFNNVGLFDESLKFGEDWDMWLRISERYEVDYSNKVLVSIRRHDKNMTSQFYNVLLGEISFMNHWNKILGQNAKVPIFWSDKLSFYILKSLPSIKSIAIIKKNLSCSLYNKFYKYFLGSIFLYTVFFVIKTIIFFPFSKSLQTKTVSRFKSFLYKI